MNRDCILRFDRDARADSRAHSSRILASPLIHGQFERWKRFLGSRCSPGAPGGPFADAPPPTANRPDPVPTSAACGAGARSAAAIRQPALPALAVQLLQLETNSRKSLRTESRPSPQPFEQQRVRRRRTLHPEAAATRQIRPHPAFEPPGTVLDIARGRCIQRQLGSEPPRWLTFVSCPSYRASSALISRVRSAGFANGSGGAPRSPA